MKKNLIKIILGSLIGISIIGISSFIGYSKYCEYKTNQEIQMQLNEDYKKVMDCIELNMNNIKEKWIFKIL